MPKAIVVAVGEPPLNPLNDLLKQNTISTIVIDAAANSVDEIDKLIKADEQCQCVLLKGVNLSSQHIARFAGATEKLVLLYCSPTTTLSHSLEISNGSIEPEQAINWWQESVSQAMELVQECDSYLLCDLNDILDHPSPFLAEFFAIEKAAESKPSTYTKKQFANHLAKLHLFKQDDAFALYDEALSIGKLFGEFTVHLGPDTEEVKQSAVDSGQSVFNQLISNHQDIQSKSNEIQSLKAQSSENVNALEKQIAELQHAKMAFEENNIQLQEELKKNETLADQLSSKIAILQDGKQNIESKLQATTAQLEKSQNEMTALASELSTKEASLTESQERLTNLQSQFQGKEQKNAQLQRQLEEFKASSAELTEELSHQKQVIAESEKDRAAKTAALKEIENKLQSVNKQVSELHSEKTELTNTVQQIKEQLVKLQSTNEAKEQECAELSNELTQAQASLQEATGKLAKHHDENLGAIQELQLANLQVAQLQEELEATFSELQKTRATEVLYEESQNELTAITQKVERLTQEKELSDLQISQLQEELELITIHKAELEAANSSSENVIAEKSRQIDLLTHKNEELAAQSSSLKKQVEATIKRRGLEEQELIHELQAQIEQQVKQSQLLENNNARLQEQLSQSEAGMSHNNEFQKAELELASLQISQLQEELEYYYSAWQQAQQKGTQVVKMGKHHQKVFNKAQAETLAVTGKYSEDGYQDVHFMLTNVLLGDGRSFAELPVKLVRIGEYVAIEFRDQEQGGLFQHFEDATDEYGPYLRFFANPPESNVEQQAHVYSRMNASERILVMSTIALLAELMQVQDISCNVNLSNEEWRNWRLSAIELVEIIEQQPNWLSFDRVLLKEEYRTDGYEHLWLAFQNVLVGEFWKEQLEIKVAATDVNKSGSESFCEAILLEFREGDDGTPPLLSWPAETEDEYGPKYVVSIGNLDDIANLATVDKNLITHLANNLPSIIDKLEEQDASMSRPKSDWKAASSLKFNNANEAEEVIQQEERSTLTLEEVISMGSYQHLLFAYKDQETKIKLKAQNINPDTFDAELFIELRNGTPEIIYSDTEFFGEDEFGPRVMIPAESFFGDILQSRISEFGWLVNTYDKVFNKLESGDGIDELVKRLWLNMIKRKKDNI